LAVAFPQLEFIEEVLVGDEFAGLGFEEGLEVGLGLLCVLDCMF